MSDNRLVSVIIVNFNGGELLTQCVHSVLASTNRVEVLVVDNASTDGSILTLRRYYPGEGRLSILENPANLGFATANNLGVKQAKGKYLLLLNPDCIVGPDTIERMSRAMEEAPETGLAGCLIRNVDGSEQRGCRRMVPTPWRTLVRVAGLGKLFPRHRLFKGYDLCAQPLPLKPVPVDAISGSFMFVRRSALEKVGGLDEGYFLHCEDLDWCMRFHEEGYTILFVPDVVVTHHKGICGRGRRIRVMWHMHKGMTRFYKKHFRGEYPLFLMWMVLVAIWARFAVFALLAFAQGRLAATARESDNIPNFQVVPRVKQVPPGGIERPVTVVTGATSQIGYFLLPKLVGRGQYVYALSRNETVLGEGKNIAWVQAELESKKAFLDVPGAGTLVHIAPLWLLPDRIPELSSLGIRRIVAFSSTSRYTKLDSSCDEEKAIASALSEAEEKCKQLCKACGIALTIFRPTMIYGCGMDQTVTTIAKFITRYRFFPVAGPGNGRRQPVHAEDLANACIAAMQCGSAYGRSYNLSGGETLSYRDMVTVIFEALGRKPRILEIPPGILRLAFRGMAIIPMFRHITPEMVDRMNRDLCFEHADAIRDFGYHPRCFLETTERKERDLYRMLSSAVC